MESAGLLLVAQSEALTRAMDVVANNVANVNTTGFKRQDVKFDSLINRADAKNDLRFPSDAGTLRDTSEGPIMTTSNPLDVAIQGTGYFEIQTSGGTRYTRAGSFQLNNQGQMVDGVGNPVLGDGEQPITLPDDSQDVHISTDGVVTVKSGTTAAVTQVGKLKTVKFAKEQDLLAVGGGLYSTDQAAQPDTNSQMIQGSLERSNVQSVTEITHMIDVMRSYQVTMKLIDNENQRISGAISRLSKATA